MTKELCKNIKGIVNPRCKKCIARFFKEMSKHYKITVAVVGKKSHKHKAIAKKKGMS